MRSKAKDSGFFSNGNVNVMPAFFAVFFTFTPTPSSEYRAIVGWTQIPVFTLHFLHRLHGPETNAIVNGYPLFMAAFSRSMTAESIFCLSLFHACQNFCAFSFRSWGMVGSVSAFERIFATSESASAWVLNFMNRA